MLDHSFVIDDPVDEDLLQSMQSHVFVEPLNLAVHPLDSFDGVASGLGFRVNQEGED